MIIAENYVRFCFVYPYFEYVIQDSDVNLKMRGKNELDNFVAKFHKLLEAGFTAHLDVDANAGQVWVGL